MIVEIVLHEDNFMGDDEFALEFSRALHKELTEEYPEWDVFVSVGENECVDIFDTNIGFDLTISKQKGVDWQQINNNIKDIRDTLWNNWSFE